jgi:glycosyltransferase involved in cell wall biosynthesis
MISSFELPTLGIRSQVDARLSLRKTRVCGIYGGMIDSAVQRNTNAVVFDWLIGQSHSPSDLVQKLVGARGPHGQPARIALLVKNLNLSGGNRVIFSLFDRLQSSLNAELHVFVVPDAKRHIKEFFDLAACRRRYGLAASVTRISRPIDPEKFDLVISTSRRTLDFVRNLASPRHVHLLQAIEAWDTLNSEPFCRFCVERRYPTPAECVELVRTIGLPRDVHYLEQIIASRRFLTVSEYMASAIRYAGQSQDVIISEPKLEIRGTVSPVEKTIDFLFFVRGFPYNGDALAITVANALPDRYRIAIVGPRRAKAEFRSLEKHSHGSVVRAPPGFIPQEALSFGCAVVASRTGWLFSAKSKSNLTIVDRHDPNIYLAEALRALEDNFSVPPKRPALSIASGSQLSSAHAQ